MEIALPLPDMLASELANTAAVATISSHAHLFTIVMPIKTDHFEALLESHLNRLLVESICRGLRQGFWPYVNVDGNTPTTWVGHCLATASGLHSSSKTLKLQRAASHPHSGLTCSLECTAFRLVLC